MISISDNLLAITKRIQSAEQSAGRPPHSVQLLAVSKGFGPAAIEQLYKAGQLDFGENYLQDALGKIMALKAYPLCWHFIGHLQSNKLKTIAQHFSWVHSLSRLDHAQRLSEYRESTLSPLNICLQVKTDPSPLKGGVTPEELPDLIQEISHLPNIKLRGLMTLPPMTEDVKLQREYFSILTKLLSENQAMFPTLSLDTLSMGTTADLEAAIAAGSTLVRIGTGLFGSRK